MGTVQWSIHTIFLSYHYSLPTERKVEPLLDYAHVLQTACWTALTSVGLARKH